MRRSSVRTTGAIRDLFCHFPSLGEQLGEFSDLMDALDLTYFRRVARRVSGSDGKPPKQRMPIAGYLQLLSESFTASAEHEEMLW